jgi:hypothetical protein
VRRLALVIVIVILGGACHSNPGPWPSSVQTNVYDACAHRRGIDVIQCDCILRTLEREYPNWHAYVSATSVSVKEGRFEPMVLAARSCPAEE